MSFSTQFWRTLQRSFLTSHRKRLGVCSQCRSCSGTTQNETGSKDSGVDHAPMFSDPDVQEILLRLTGFNMDRIFKARLTPDYAAPDYKLMTDEQLRESQEGALQAAALRLQMPPVLKPRDNEEYEIICNDPEIDGYSQNNIVFTDITYGIPRHSRTVVVRQPDGVLRTATPVERDRALMVYDPLPGKMYKPPAMFSGQHLERVLGEGKYQYVLDRACVQFEPDDPEYSRVTGRVYEHIESTQSYNSLRHTRHFGGLVFYLTSHSKVGGMIVHMLQYDLLNEAHDLVRLHHILHPDTEAAKATTQGTDPLEAIKIFASHDTKEGGRIELALQAYIDSHTAVAQ